MTTRVPAAALLACLAASGCVNLAQGDIVRAGKSSQPARAAFVPPEGKTLLIAGQDTFPAARERLWLGPAGGFMTYSRLGPVLDDAGDGPRELEEAIASIKGRATRLPYSALQLGLYVVGHLGSIRSGALDANIDRLVTFLKGLERPVYLRFGYEVDGAWNHHDPAEFRDAWLHFRARLLALRADNVVMVWHAAADCTGSYRGRAVEEWYPGDEAVDWIALSWFWPGECDYRGPREVLAFARKHGKPLMIAESTPRGYDLLALTYSRDGKHFEPRTPEQIWQGWFVPYLDFISANADVLRAVSYINENWKVLSYAKDYWGDARLQANPEILARWHTLMRDPRWLRGGPELMHSLTKP